MNDPLLYADKFEELVRLAADAETPFERAAIFAATLAIAREFDGREDEFGAYALEKVSQARGHICSAIGYDVTNGHSADQHRVWALGAIGTLRNVLEKRQET